MRLIFFLIILFYYPPTIYSQNKTAYFSLTGDTVMFRSQFNKETDSLFGIKTFTICKLNNQQYKKITNFTCEGTSTKISFKDTINKYKLHITGMPIEPNLKNGFDISIQHTEITIVDTIELNKVFRFGTKVSLAICFKKDTVFAKSFDIFFKGQAKEDFSKLKLVELNAWKIRYGIYFMEIALRNIPVILMPDKKPSYFFNYYQIKS